MKYSKFFMFSLLIAGILFFNRAVLAAGFEGKIVEKDITVQLSAFPSVNPEDNSAVADNIFSKSTEELKKIAPEGFAENTATIYIKGKMYRVDSEQEGHKMSMIYDMTTHKMTTLQWDSKTAMVTNVDEINENVGNMMKQMPQTTEGEKKESDFSMKATGKTKTINGRKCALFEGTDSDGHFSHIWLDTGDEALFNSFIPIFTAMQDMGGENKDNEKEEQFYRQEKGFPILTKTVNGDEVDIQETVEITKQSVSDDQFTIPAGFKEMNMQQMIQEQMKKYQDQFNKQQ